MNRTINVLELRCVRGPGGGPEKTILNGAAQADPNRLRVSRNSADPAFRVNRSAFKLGLDYVEVRERHPFAVEIVRALQQLVRQRTIHIVHAHEYKTDFLALVLGRLEGIIPVATVHGWTGNTRREKVYYALDRRLLSAFPRVIAVSDQIRRELTRYGLRDSKICTIRNAIDVDRFRRIPERRAQARAALGITSSQVAVGAVGRLEQQKRFDVLLRALVVIRQKRPDAELWIAGEGSCRQHLQNLARDLGLGGACHFLGHVDDVVDLHHALDVFVQSADYEGTPNAVLEAMALETPILATNVGGTAELLDEGIHGRLVPPGSPDTLGQALLDVLEDPWGAMQRCLAARKKGMTCVTRSPTMPGKRPPPG
jgi:glycosyltransferase involved in cell wall biosynthesis